MIKKIFVLIIFVLFQTNINASSFKPIIEGREDAKIKLIIYESLTCSFCADFHNKVYPELKKEFIDTGIINIEFRNFPLDLAALNASKIAHCENNGDSKILHYLYKRQNQWIKGNNILEINSNLKNSLKDSNFNLDFEKCVNNKNLEDHILEERIDGAKKYNIQSTPTLIINDKKFDKKLNYKNLKKTLEKLI